MSVLEEGIGMVGSDDVARMALELDARRRAEAALQETLFLHEQAQALAHVGSWVSDADPGGRSIWSKELYRILGVEEGTPIGVERVLAIVHPDDVELVSRTRKNTIERGEPYDVKFRIRRTDGEVRWIHAKGMVVRDPAGKPLRLMGVSQDVTAQRRATEELRDSEQRCQQMIEMTSVGIWKVDAEAKTIFTNARMAAMLGYEPHELVGRCCLDFVAPGSLQRSQMALARRCAVPEQFEVELLCKDGSSRYVLVENTPILDANGSYDGEFAVIVDVTARKRAEQQLGISEAQLRLLLDSTGEALYGVDADGKCVFANPACIRMLGYERVRDVLGKDMHALTHHTRRDGSPCSGSACRIHAAMAASGAVHVDDEVLWRADGTCFDVEVRSFPVRLQGMGMSAIISFVDITDRRRAEAALRQAQKMEAIGRLAGGVAHDFNNLLCVILTYTTLALDSLAGADPLRSDLEEIRAAGERAAELTKQLLAFSRRQVLEPTELDVEEVLGSVEKMLRRLLGEDIALSVSVTDSPRVHADRGQLDQVLMNLAVNARDAMPDGGALEIAASVVEIDAAEAARRDGIAPGAYVLFSVTDTGCGMPPEIASRAFEPFFTTKELGRGTGLGLSTMFGVVKQSGGSVTLSSEPGRGARFEILLPHTRKEANAVSISKSAPDGARGTETILLVEDDAQVRALVRVVLRGQGYDVIDVSNAGEALLVSEQHAGPIHLLLTDVVLPRMSGRQLAERVAPLRPEMRVLYVSGYTDDEVFHRGVHAEGGAFLHKPFTPASIVRKVREVLDQVVRPAAIAC